MTLLYIYIGTILLYFLGILCFSLDVKKRLLKEYKIKNIQFLSVVNNIFMSIVPISNFIFGLILIFDKDLKEMTTRQIYIKIHK
jgi:hypothetical protein